MMGLDTSHDCWHGSYGGFKEFRDVVAKAAKAHYGYEPNFDGHPMRAYYGWWDDDHRFSNILDVFFVHSDCEGYIFPQHAERLAHALTPLIGQVDREFQDAGAPFSPLATFVTGLLKAHENYEIVEFH